MAQILVVDDERSMREMLQLLFERDGHAVSTAKSVKAALDSLRESPDLVFTDMRLPDGSGLEVLSKAHEALPETQVIVMTAFGTTENAVEAMRQGAYDYQIKPVKVDEIRAVTEKALEKVALIRDNRQLSAQLRNQYGLSRLLGKSPRMVEVMELVEKVAPSGSNVLIEGESGTGKELVARAIHEGSRQANGPFVAVNCGAIPDTLIESELFGHAAGAFTSAARARAGLFETAKSGTLLLDEIGELPGPMQVKLLRVLQERMIRRVGEERERPVEVRVVAATNLDLHKMVQAGRFREDLFYRLNVVRIRVPPLRQRREDIPVLARAFVLKYAQKSGKPVEGMSPEALSALCAYDFPGNVRELENYVERAVTLVNGNHIHLEDLPEDVRTPTRSLIAERFSEGNGTINLEETLEKTERQLIDEALRRSDGVKTRAAELLGLSFRSLRYRMQKLGYGDES